MWYLYIVECSDKSYYTGISTDVARRLQEHNNKIGAKSIRGKLPVKLVYFETFPDKYGAAKREREIKGWSRKKKINLIKGLPCLPCKGTK